MSFCDTVAQATAVVGYNLFINKEFTKGPKRISKFGIVGSNAIGDTEVELWAGQRFIGRFKNTTAGANQVPQDEDMVYVNRGPRKNEELRCIVTDAPAANDIVYKISFAAPRMFRRSTYRRYGTQTSNVPYSRPYTSYPRNRY